MRAWVIHGRSPTNVLGQLLHIVVAVLRVVGQLFPQERIGTLRLGMLIPPASTCGRRVEIEVEVAKLVECSGVLLNRHLLEHEDLELILVARGDEGVGARACPGHGVRQPAVLPD